MPEIPRSVIGKVPDTIAHLYHVVPIAIYNNILSLASPAPFDAGTTDELLNLLSAKTPSLTTVEPTVQPSDEIQRALEYYYPRPDRNGEITPNPPFIIHPAPEKPAPVRRFDTHHGLA